jgi:hypothetical protein
MNKKIFPSGNMHTLARGRQASPAEGGTGKRTVTALNLMKINPSIAGAHTADGV